MSALLSTMIVLFAIIIIGYIAGKTNTIYGAANSVLSNLMMNVTAPALILSSVASSEPGDVPVNIFEVMILGVITYVVLIIIGRLYVKIVPLNEFEKPVHEVGLVFGNTAFLGYPIFTALLGPSAIFVSTILNLPFNILMFSYGMHLFTKDIEGEKTTLKSILNPAFIAAILALLIYLFGVQVPDVLNQILSSVGDITIPMSMLLIGSSLAEIDIKYLFKDYKVLIYSFVKLLLLPTIVFFVTKAIGLEPYLIKMLTLNIGFPAASTVVMFATQYKKSTRSASILVFVSTLLAIATIPLIEKFLFALI